MDVGRRKLLIQCQSALDGAGRGSILRVILRRGEVGRDISMAITIEVIQRTRDDKYRDNGSDY